MKKRFILPAIAALATVAGIAVYGGAKDPVLMQVNGKDVPLSEFMYIYQKNNQQQENPQSIDEYLDLFVAYKLKVADAEAAGIDTTAAFRKEYQGFVKDLAEPYMRDEEVEKQLIAEAYARMQRNLDVSHIMLPFEPDDQKNEANKQLLDSIRTAIIGGADFGELAAKYSSDGGSAQNGGHLGYIAVNRLPFPFEDAAYKTPVGQISEVVEDLPYGYHIIRVNGERMNPGEVHAAHILKLTRGLSDEQKAVAKAQIDSIYNVLKGGADFAEVARSVSDDGTREKGGDLGWFGAGRMVPEFETVAFSLADGEFSEPFESRFGYHIIKRYEHKDGPTFEEATPDIVAAIARDDRSRLPRKAKMDQYRKQYNATLIDGGMAQVKKIIDSHSGCDSLCIAELRKADIKVARVGNTDITTSQIFKTKRPISTNDPAKAYKSFTERVNSQLDQATADYAREQLAVDNPDYRNLVNEYRDGILLFEISNRNVWDRSSKDKEGLESFFRANRGKYTWDKPHYKGYVIFATNDSIADSAREYLKNNTVDNDSLVAKLRELYNHSVRVERVVSGQGDNAIVDYIAFGGERPANDKTRWTSFFGYEGRVIDAPEEATDVRGAVSADYQAYLEKEWVDSLKAKYPVKINKKVLKSVK